MALTSKKVNKGTKEETFAVSRDFARAPTLEELAEAQGVKPIKSLNELPTDPTIENAEIEWFLAELRRIREDGDDVLRH